MKENERNVLVSACLLGINCRYDGGNSRNEQVLRLMEHYHLVPVCPEQLGGLKTPREPAECRACHEGEKEEVRVVAKTGEDVTESFDKGAAEALKLAKLYECKTAILKERSPSCGFGMIYDGTFSGNKVPGNGRTAKLLAQNGIRVLGEGSALELLKQERKE